MINLEDKYLKFIATILKKYVPNNTVWLFGSRVTSKIKPYSDIDIAIITDNPLSIQIMSHLTHAFSDSDLPYKVDIVDWSLCDDEFQKIIESNHEVIQKGNP